MSDTLEQVLGSVPMLRHLSGGQRRRLARRCSRRRYEAGDVIIREGDTSMSFYVVLSGQVRITRAAAGDDGVDIIKEGPGSYFGEMGVIDDQPRSATVAALAPTECVLLGKWDFLRAIGR